MRLLPQRVLLVALAAFATGCASRPLPKFEKPIARAQFQTIRTTAYTHTESDHRQYANRSAAGTPLRTGSTNSAACDWSRWPVGTQFRIIDTGDIYEVDDYGWALSGTNTMDLYKPSRSAMNSWGVRRVNIEILRWGDVDRSLAILRPRAGYRHIKRMLQQIDNRYAELSTPLPLSNPEPVIRTAPMNPPAPAYPVVRQPFFSSR